MGRSSTDIHVASKVSAVDAEHWRLSALLPKYILLLFLAVAMVAAKNAAAELEQDVAGQMRFYNLAKSAFNAYSRNPSSADAAWMRKHYRRMHTFSPYFDSRTAWFPNAWVYKDAYALYPTSPLVKQHPEWVLRNAAGAKLYIPWGCSGGTCPQYAADFGNPAYRRHWIAQARALIDKGYRGIWIDDVNLTWRVGNGNGKRVEPMDPRTGKTMTLANWRRYLAEFMEEIRDALPTAELVHNIIWYAGPWDDPYIVRQIDAADYINLERGANDRGLIGGNGRFGVETFLGFLDFLHSRGKGIVLMDSGKTTRQREYGLAAWYLISNGTDLYNSNQLGWTAPDRFWHGYKLNLGKALGSRFTWKGVLRRDFACGIVLFNQPDMPTRRLDLGGKLTTLTGASVATVTLGEMSAAILTRPCVDDTVSDNRAPTVLSAAAVDGTTVSVTYSEDMNEASAETAAHYSLSGASVSRATLLGDGQTVLLKTSALVPGLSYTLAIADVKDLAGNAVAANTEVHFGHGSQMTVSFQNGVSPTAGYAGTRDVYLSQNIPSGNAGGDSVLLIDGDDPRGTGRDLATLIAWDVSTIPSGATVESASIAIRVSDRTPHVYRIYEMRRPWQEYRASWKQYAAGAPWGAPGASGPGDRGNTVLGTLTAARTGSYTFALNANGVALVQDWVNGAKPNNGLILSNGKATNGMDIRSSNAAAAQQRPALRVTYSVPAGGGG